MIDGKRMRLLRNKEFIFGIVEDGADSGDSAGLNIMFSNTRTINRFVVIGFVCKCKNSTERDFMQWIISGNNRKPKVHREVSVKIENSHNVIPIFGVRKNLYRDKFDLYALE